jgi:hypothetical protein
MREHGCVLQASAIEQKDFPRLGYQYHLRYLVSKDPTLDTSGENQVQNHAGFSGETSGGTQDRIFQHCLNGSSDIHVLLLDPALGIARRPAKQRIKALVGHGKASAIVK